MTAPAAPLYRMITSADELRPCQTAAIEAVRSSKLQRVMVSMPTGTGKTTVALSLIGETPGRSLMIAHRRDLIRQAFECAKERFPGLDVGLVRAHHDEYNRRVTMATMQTLGSERRLGRVLGAGPLSMIVIDEAHRGAADTYMEILTAAGAFREGGPRVVGLTATAQRSDYKSLYPTFEKTVYYLSLPDAIEQKILVPMIPLEVPLQIDSTKVKREKQKDGTTDVNLDDMAKELERCNAAQATANVIKTKVGDRRTIVFTCSVNQAQRTTEELRKLGISADWISGSRPEREQRAVLAAHSAGKFQVLSNCQLLGEGYDDPMLGCVVMARPTASVGVWVQAVGRGLRSTKASKEAGKTDCLVVDIVGASRLGLVTASEIMIPERLPLEPLDERERSTEKSDEDGEIERVRNFLKKTRTRPSEVEGTFFVDVNEDLVVTVTRSGTPLLLKRGKKGTRACWSVNARGHALTDDLDLATAIHVAVRLCPEFGGPADYDDDAWKAFKEGKTL